MNAKEHSMRIGVRLMLGVAALCVAAPAVSPAQAAIANKKLPFFGSIAAKKARMRSGPGRSYPASWLYQRADLPVKVIAVFEHGQWYKIEDPSGTQGWMTAALLSATRTALVTGQDPVELRDSPSVSGRIVWRAAPGVVGRLRKCAEGWCYLDVHGRGGFVEAGRLWGIDAAETLP